MAYHLDRVLREKKIVDVTNAASLAQGVDVTAVGEVFLKSPQGRIHLKKQGNGWQLLEPIKAQADPETIETMLTNVTSARRTNENQVKNLAEFGLANPDVEVSFVPEAGKEFRTDNKTSFSLQLGNESPYTGLAFAKFPDKPGVFTVGIQVKNSLLRGVNDLRKSRLFDVDTSALDQYTALHLHQASGDVVLKNEVGRWKIAVPFEGAAEESVVREHLTKLGLLRANSFLSQTTDKPTSMAAAMQALTSPTLTLTLESSRAKPQVLIVAEAPGENGTVYVAQRAGDDELMALRSETVEDLRTDAQYFRSRDLFTMKAADVGLFTVQLGRAPASALIRNDKDTWELVGDPERRIDQKSVSEKLDALLRVRVKEYIDPDPKDPSLYGLDIPRRRYSVTSKDKSRTEALETGGNEPGKPGTVYARRTGDKSIFTVELSGDLAIYEGSIADKHFAKTDLSVLTRAELDVDKQTYTLKVENGEWKILKPSQTAFATLDIRRLQALVDALNNMEYEKDLTAAGQTVIAPKPGPPLAVRFYGKDDRELLDLNVTKRLGANTIIMSGGNRSLEVNGSTVDRLYSLAQSLVQ